MLSIPETVEMDEEVKTKKINCKFLAAKAAEESTTISKLSIISGFGILLQWTMKLVDHLN